MAGKSLCKWVALFALLTGSGCCSWCQRHCPQNNCCCQQSSCCTQQAPPPPPANNCCCVPCCCCCPNGAAPTTSQSWQRTVPAGQNCCQ